MTYQAKILIMIMYFLVIFRGTDSRKGKNPVKRSGLAISSIMNDLIIDERSDLASNSPFNRMFLPNGDDTRRDYLDLVKLLRQHQETPLLQSRQIPLTQYTEARVDITVGNELVNADYKLQVRGKFGHHSPHKTVSGHLIHIRDERRSDVHDGCSKRLADIPANMDPWIALISRGNCSFSKKIRLAEKYNASAVIIYNTNDRTDVEVMRMPGTKIPALLINSTSGQKLAHLSRKASPVMTEITVGPMNILTSKPAPEEISQPRNATIHFQSKKNGSPPTSINNITSVMGNHSPSKKVSGKLIHIKDFDSDNTHFGCSGKISNGNKFNMIEGAWIALIARGKCADLIKVKLAEKYHASAVIIYNRNYMEQENPLYVFSAQIPIMSLGVSDGRKSLDLLKRERSNLYVEITTEKVQSPSPERNQRPPPLRNGDPNSVLRSPQTVIFNVIILNILFIGFR